MQLKLGKYCKHMVFDTSEDPKKIYCEITGETCECFSPESKIPELNGFIYAYKIEECPNNNSMQG